MGYSGLKAESWQESLKLALTTAPRLKERVEVEHLQVSCQPPAINDRQQ